MHITTTAIVALQLALGVNAAGRPYVTYFYALNDPKVRKVGLCSSSGRRDGPVVFKCGSQGTTVTVNGQQVTLRAPKIDSQVAIVCGSSEAWQFCPAGMSDRNTLDACKNDVQIWSALKSN